MLIPEDVMRMVEDLEKMKGDDECAHSEEDRIHQLVLKAIANGDALLPNQCAREALKTLDLDFERWCA